VAPTTALIAELANSTLGASVVTSTLCHLATCNVKFSILLLPTVSLMPVCTWEENPWTAALIS